MVRGNFKTKQEMGPFVPTSIEKIEEKPHVPFTYIKQKENTDHIPLEIQINHQAPNEEKLEAIQLLMEEFNQQSDFTWYKCIAFIMGLVALLLLIFLW